MPIYEYQCKACEQIHEAWQKITEDALTECPECGGELERLISATAFHLKGSGWYKSDYKDAAQVPKQDQKDDGAAATTEKDGSGSTADTSGSSDDGWKPGYGPEGKKKEAPAEAKPAPEKPKPKKENKAESKSESKAGSKPAPETKKPKS